MIDVFDFATIDAESHSTITSNNDSNDNKNDMQTIVMNIDRCWFDRRLNSAHSIFDQVRFDNHGRKFVRMCPHFVILIRYSRCYSIKHNIGRNKIKAFEHKLKNTFISIVMNR